MNDQYLQCIQAVSSFRPVWSAVKDGPHPNNQTLVGRPPDEASNLSVGLRTCSIGIEKFQNLLKLLRVGAIAVVQLPPTLGIFFPPKRQT